MSFLQKEEIFSSQLRREMRHEHKCLHPKETCDKLIDTRNTAGTSVIPTSGPAREGGARQNQWEGDSGGGTGRHAEDHERKPAVNTISVLRKESSLWENNQFLQRAGFCQFQCAVDLARPDLWEQNSTLACLPTWMVRKLTKCLHT